MIKVYTKQDCANCLSLKALLNRKGIAFEEVTDETIVNEFAQANGMTSAPFVEHEGLFLGYYKAIQSLSKLK